MDRFKLVCTCIHSGPVFRRQSDAKWGENICHKINKFEQKKFGQDKTSLDKLRQVRTNLDKSGQRQVWAILNKYG